jgi:hypothetical protein
MIPLQVPQQTLEILLILLCSSQQTVIVMFTQIPVTVYLLKKPAGGSPTVLECPLQEDAA